MKFKLKHLDVFTDRHGKRRYYVRLDGKRTALPDPGNGIVPSREFLLRYREIVDLEPEPVKRDIRLERGEVYIAGFDRYVKIGFTRHLRRRISTLSTGCPTPITVYHTFIGTIRDEEAMHGRFAHLRLRNEWFHFVDDLEEWVRSEQAQIAPASRNRFPTRGRRNTQPEAPVSITARG